MFIPEFLRPFDWSMAALVVAWVLSCAITLHRVVGYFARRNNLVWLEDELHRSLRWPRRIAPREIERVMVAARSDQPLDEVIENVWEESWREDRQLVSFLAGLKQLATLFGLAGTVSGILLAVSSIHGDTITMKELGPALGLALKTTLYGALTAALCLITERLPYREQQQKEAKWTAKALSATKQSFKGETDDGQSPVA